MAEPLNTQAFRATEFAVWSGGEVGFVVEAAVDERAAEPLVKLDAILAATAFDHDLVFVTRNVRDFQDMDVTILNPWEAV